MDLEGSSHLTGEETVDGNTPLRSRDHDRRSERWRRSQRSPRAGDGCVGRPGCRNCPGAGGGGRRGDAGGARPRQGRGRGRSDSIRGARGGSRFPRTRTRSTGEHPYCGEGLAGGPHPAPPPRQQRRRDGVPPRPHCRELRAPVRDQSLRALSLYRPLDAGALALDARPGGQPLFGGAPDVAGRLRGHPLPRASLRQVGGLRSIEDREHPLLGGTRSPGFRGAECARTQCIRG